MHKQREEDRISGAANKPSAEDEFNSRVRESEVREDTRFMITCAHLNAILPKM